METAAPLDLSFYKAALIVLAAAVIVIPLFHRLRVSSVLGFILVGIVVGPFGLASLAPNLPWLSAISIGEPGTIEPIANLGVVLLLFMIGLELSFERLVVMRRRVFGLGSLQFVLCSGALSGGAMLLGHGSVSAADSDRLRCRPHQRCRLYQLCRVPSPALLAGSGAATSSLARAILALQGALASSP